MHINTMYESQAIKLLAEVCDALGIDQDNRTREEIRAKLKQFKELQQPDKGLGEMRCSACWIDASEVLETGYYWFDFGHPQGPVIIQVGRQSVRHAFREMLGNGEGLGRSVQSMGGKWMFIEKPKPFLGT